MRVIILKPAYRCRLGHEHTAGDECDLPDHVAVKLIEQGVASAVRTAPVERAVKKPPETAATTRKQKKAVS